MKKHLYGFYVIHLGLILLFIGSFVTYQSGIDGTMTLYPNTPSRDILLNENHLKIQFPSQGKEVTVDLPYSSREKNLDLNYEGIKLKSFLPFADQKLDWTPLKVKDASQSSGRYRLFNDNFGETITMTLHPLSDFTNTQTLGPLSVHYMPKSLTDCFAKKTSQGFIIWNGEKGNCLAPADKEIKNLKSLNGQKLSEINFEGQSLRFLPDLSPLPLAHDGKLIENSPYRLFSKKLFESSPHLFIFGENVGYFLKDQKEWVVSSFSSTKGPIPLPWMGFKIELMDYFEDKYPVMRPFYVKPIQDDGKMISGELKAVEVEIDGKSFWVNSQEPISYLKDDEKIVFELGKKSIQLPYEITLDRFKMDKDPGTNNPASFESFITLFLGDQGSQKHHVYMNHPLKKDNFTFYQASYFELNPNQFGSVLSVNFDPGRSLKYFASFLIVIGSIWHFGLRRKKRENYA